MGENTVKFIQAIVLDDQFALAFCTMLDHHTGTHPVAQLLLQAADIGVDFLLCLLRLTLGVLQGVQPTSFFPIRKSR